jgi:hypothetical protein
MASLEGYRWLIGSLSLNAYVLIPPAILTGSSLAKWPSAGSIPTLNLPLKIGVAFVPSAEGAAANRRQRLSFGHTTT